MNWQQECQQNAFISGNRPGELANGFHSSLLLAHLVGVIIALHGTEENFERVEKMSPEAFEESVDAIRLAALDLHAYWMAHPQEKVGYASRNTRWDKTETHKASQWLARLYMF